MLITFSGLDGTGKTTHARKTVEFLRKNNIKARYVRMYRASLLYCLGRLMPQKMRNNMVESQFSRRKTLKNDILNTIRKVTCLIDLLIFRLIYLTNNLKTTTMVYDRYFYDVLVHLMYLQKKNNIFTRIYAFLIKKPTISFLLITTPEKAYQRKKEYNQNYFDEKQELYLRIGSKVSKVIQEKTLGQSQEIIEEFILKRKK